MINVRFEYKIFFSFKIHFSVKPTNIGTDKKFTHVTKKRQKNISGYITVCSNYRIIFYKNVLFFPSYLILHISCTL